MTTLAEKAHHTPEDLLTMPEGEHYELVDGELVEKEMGWKASWIAGRIFSQLANFNDRAQLGWVAPPEASYQCFPEDPTRVRRPDGSFVRGGSFPGGEMPEGHCRVVPDLVVEVVSPNDPYADVRRKVGEYLRAGMRLVWVVEPETRTVEVSRADGTVTMLYGTGELDGEDVLPGFRCALETIFPPRPEQPVETEAPTVESD
jgi:Uma2 family endonuclease